MMSAIRPQADLGYPAADAGHTQEILPVFDYCDLLIIRERENALRVWHAVGVVLGAMGIAALIFLASSNPQGADLLLFAALQASLIGLVTVPFLSVRLSRLRRRRLQLTRKLYARGLRLDGADNLTTDEAHARIIIGRARAGNITEPA